MKKIGKMFITCVTLTAAFFVIKSFDGASANPAYSGEGKKATCSLKGFKDFPEKITGPVTLELKTLVTVMLDGENDSIEVTVRKDRCEIK